MCVTCGCSDDSETTMTNPQTGEKIEMKTHHHHPHSHTHTLADGTVVEHTHPHSQTHKHPTSLHEEHTHTLADGTVVTHTHAHASEPPKTEAKVSEIHAKMHGNTIALEEAILGKNNLIAAQNRGWFKGRNILALNLVSSPGSGKTTLLTRTINDLKSKLTFSVIEGDQETINDAEKIRATGCNVVQINTGTGCHLEAAMIERGCEELNPPLNSIVMIENVGNLVCPALFDLGEKAKVAILSVTEGEDKPIKYPHMFRASQVMILTKIDLLPYVQFDVQRCLDYARQVNPKMQIFQVSASTGEGLNAWYDWLKSQSQQL
ncbi:hydrogenase nickel incorporation protein HypB [Limnoraphis robusta]|uniref:Hydrogenase nickel incorporation protein HypB n=1 Tax=Limnoraphis robusta CCNP1315 TaxID=3110306 RepID=A0ABU5TTJ0_9CYAN|nr:hydrogenase nickel incorporation protein HypB [Limnoraphis robusta]MEA5518010.1 hydrogenase nickel incorporation protein HypB [Limnoraphis robusta CCNP1315]MEA5547261.1 hydrogenase nickel incorporation protein HypB [Limnoraphis robusta CCNP1324]